MIMNALLLCFELYSKEIAENPQKSRQNCNFIMKIVYFSLMVLLLFGAASCGESEKKDEVKLTVEVDLGELGNYLSLDDEVIVKKEEIEEDGDQIIVFKSSLGANVNKSVASNFSFDFDAKILDKDHIEIAEFPGYEMECNSDFENENFNNILFAGTKRAILDWGITKKEWKEEYQKIWERIREEAVYIQIKPKYSSAKFVAYNGSASDSSKMGTENDENTDNEEIEVVKPSLEIILPSSLKGKVEIAFCGEVTESSYGYPEVEIGFKLLQTVNTSSLVSSYNQLWIVGVGQDENGRDVKELLPNYGEWRTGDSDGKEFKEFLESEPGETINMTFTGGKEGDVSEGISKVAKFKLKISN